METAEHAFYRSIGHSVVMKNADQPLGWPRVHAECDYFAPLQKWLEEQNKGQQCGW